MKDVNNNSTLKCVHYTLQSNCMKKEQQLPDLNAL